MIRFILIFLLIVYFLGFLLRILFRYFIKRIASQNSNYNSGNSYHGPQGNVTIKNTVKNKKKFSKTDGEYVDFEEVND